VAFVLPRYVIAKPRKNGEIAYHFNVPSYYKKRGCSVVSEALGTDYVRACGPDGSGGKAAALNAAFDDWLRQHKGETADRRRAATGTVEWLIVQYFRDDAFKERVSERSRPDYHRVLGDLCERETRDGGRVGDLRIDSISPLAATKLYKWTVGVDPNTGKPVSDRLRHREGEKVVTYCKTAWKVVHGLYPEWFRDKTPNPWQHVTTLRRSKKKKAAHGRDIVYRFAKSAIEQGYPQAAAAAVICFEFLQRPENVLAGYATWAGYRGRDYPTHFRIEHNKTGAIVWHPLEDDGERLYPEAEAVIGALPRLGAGMILKQKPDGHVEPYTPLQMAKIVRRLRDRLEGVPFDFTLDSCRHGGMTELEEAGLSTGQGRSLSGHQTDRAYEGYAKETMVRALEATRKRIAYRRRSVGQPKI